MRGPEEIVATIANVGTTDAAEFFALIDAPANLRGLVHVACNLSEVLPQLQALDDNKLPVEVIAELMRVSSAIAQNAQELIKMEPGVAEVSMRGVIGSNPLYAALGVTPATKEYQAAFRNLQAHLIQCAAELRVIDTEGGNTGSALSSGALAVRKVAKLKPADVARLLPKEFLSSDELLQWFRSQMREHSLNGGEGANTKTSSEILLPLERLLAYASGERHGRAREIFKNSELVVCLKDEDSLDGFSIAITQAANVTRHESEIAFAEGCAPGERYTGTSMSVLSQANESHVEEPVEVTLLRTRSSRRSMATANQSLAHRWSRLNHHDLSALGAGLRDLHCASTDRTGRRVNERSEAQYLIALVGVMLWTSSPLDRALDTRFVGSMQDLPIKPATDSVYLCCRERCWALRTYFPPERRHVREEWKPYVRNADQYVYLPVQSLIYKMFFSETVRMRSATGSSKAKMLIPKNAVCEERLSVAIREINRLYRARLTPTRISAHLFDQTREQQSDEADAIMTFGRSSSSAINNQVYYYAPSRSRLAEQYSRVSHATLQAMANDVVLKTPKYYWDSNRFDGFVGSEICLKERAVLLFADDLRQKVEAVRKKWSSKDFLIHFHNAYTAYVVMLVAFAVGHRAVCGPFSAWSNIDWQSGFAAVSDKDSDDYFNCRLVWIPSICIDQLKAYIGHCRALSARLLLLNERFADDLKQALPSDEGIAKTTALTESVVPPLFYLKRNFSPTEVRPSITGSEIGWSYDLPLNANRHFLRTQLRERQVSGEIVDAFLGHWAFGQEPYGRHSSLSPADYRHAIDGPLSDLLDACGWVVLQGLR